MAFVTKALLVGCAAVLSAPAQAALLQFTVTGGKTASFTIDSAPTPSKINSASFELANVDGTVSGGAIDYVAFYTAAGTGGILISGITAGTRLNTSGDQVFSGTLDSPIFTPGVFRIRDKFGSYTLTISDGSAPAVPEPATWAMMLVGFGMVGSAARYRRRSVKLSLA